MASLSNEPLAVGGVVLDRAGCLLVPFLPVRAGGKLVVSRTHVEFTPVLHWSWFARGVTIAVEDIAGVQLSGGGMQFSLTDFISIGRRLTITARDGRRFTFRGLQVEELYLALQHLLDARQASGPTPSDEQTEHYGQESESS